MRRNAREKNEKRPSVHDRTPKPSGRRDTGIKARRAGYPALFLGSSAVTKTLTEIGAMEPVAVNDLPERATVTDANLGHTVRRLIALGLVRRFRQPAHLDRYHLTLDRRHPLFHQVRSTLRTVAAANGLEWRPSPPPPEELAVLEGRNVTGLRPFGHPAGHIETIFGHPNRTVAVLVLGIGAADASTLARVAGVRTDGDMLRLLDPLEADGLLISEMFGSIRLYALAPAPWSSAAKNLARAILQENGQLASRVAPARALMLTGDYSNRVHLRRLLGISPRTQT
jgi:hypothetical protein